MFPASNFSQMPDMIDNVVNRNRGWVFHVQEAIHKNSHHNTSILANISKNVVRYIAQVWGHRVSP